MRTHRYLLGAIVLFAATTASIAPASAASAASLLPRCAPDTVIGGVPLTDYEAGVSTGEQNQVPDPAGAVDTKWRTVSPTVGPAYSITPNPAWVTSPVANWINSRPNSSGNGSTLLPSVTRYRTHFTLPEHSIRQLLTLDFAADNGVTFLLNGVPIGGYDPPLSAGGVADAQAFRSMHTLAWAGAGFRTGENILDAVVTDYGVATGLLVVGRAQACHPRLTIEPGTCVRVTKEAVYTYSPRPFDLGTGEQDYTPDPIGAVDTTWTTSAPVAGPAYSVATYPGWVDSTTSNWINSAPTNYSAFPTLATRTYRVEFPMGDGATYRDVDLRYAADNGVAFFLNGVPIGGFAPAAASASAFNHLHSLTWAGAGFVVGTNVLEAVVTDFGVATGLLVEGGARICYDEIRI